jgi:hypothetical protein
MSYRPRVAFATTRTHSIHGVEIDYDGEELSFTEARDRLTHYGIECVLSLGRRQRSRWPTAHDGGQLAVLLDPDKRISKLIRQSSA